MQLYNILKRKIYSYCDNNVSNDGEGVLFYEFMNCCNSEDISVPEKDLRNSIERIVKDLVKKKILEEIEKPEEFNTPFMYYKILPHAKLAE